MKKMILASLFVSCAAFGATSNLSNTRVTPDVNTVAAYDARRPIQSSHVPVASDMPFPGPGGGWPPLY